MPNNGFRDWESELMGLTRPQPRQTRGRFAPRNPVPIHTAEIYCGGHVHDEWVHEFSGSLGSENPIYHEWTRIRTVIPPRSENNPGNHAVTQWATDADGEPRVGWMISRYVPPQGDPYGPPEQYRPPYYDYRECTIHPRPMECGCWNCRHSADGQGNGECECSDCEFDRQEEATERARECGLIHSYSYKPVPSFYGNGPAFLGVELELAGNAYDSAEAVTELIGDRAYLKEDGSVCGFELVTHPHTLTAHKDEFGWRNVLRTAIDYGMQADETCGLHVHISRDAFDGPAHAFRWQALLYRNRQDMIRVARRNSTQWAAWPTRETRRPWMQHYAKSIKDTHQEYLTGRYQALNFLNPHTVEMRAFASTTDYDELMSALELVTASVEYTRAMPIQPRPVVLSVDAFRDYVKGHGYDALAHVL